MLEPWHTNLQTHDCINTAMRWNGLHAYKHGHEFKKYIQVLLYSPQEETVEQHGWQIH